MSNGFAGLKLASLSLGGGAGQLFSSLNVSVKVKNMSYLKTVQIYYRGGQFSGVWLNSPLSWTSNYGDYDLFTLATPLSLGPDPYVEFAISYTSSGNTYWDNNNFANYSLSPFVTAMTGANNVVLDSADLVWGGTPGSSYPTGIQGEILVNNLSYQKRVGIRYSIDRWITYSEIDANYNKSLGGSLESWLFGLNINPRGFGRGQFAVYYQNQETGEYYWDNNFGQDYDVKYRYRLE